MTCRSGLHPGRDVHASGFIRRKVLGLAVRCVNESACEWTGELRYMSTHLRKDCALQKIIHAMHTFVYAKPERNSNSNSNSAAGVVNDCASAAASSSVSSSCSDAIAAAVAAAFPPALMSSMSLGALYRLAGCAPALHYPSSSNEAVPFCGLAESLPLRQHWASGAGGGAKLPPLGLNGENFSAREAHRCCNDRCAVVPEAAADWVEGVDAVADCAQAASVRSWILHVLGSARRQYLGVFRSTQAHLQGLPVRVLLAMLAAKGPRDGLDNSNSPLARGALEKNDIVDACMQHRMEPDRPTASPAGGNGNGNAFGSSSRRQGDDPWTASFAPDSWSSFNDANLSAALLMQISSSLGLSLAAAAAASDPLAQHAAIHGGGRNHFDQHAAMHNFAAGRAMHQPGAGGGGGAFEPSPSSSAGAASSSRNRNGSNPDGAAAAGLAAAMMAHAHQHRVAAEARLAQIREAEGAEGHAAIADRGAQRAQGRTSSGQGSHSTASGSPTVPLFAPRRRSGSQPSATRTVQPPPSEAEPAGTPQTCCSLQ